MKVLRKCSYCKGTKWRRNTPDIDGAEDGHKGRFSDDSFDDLMICLFVYLFKRINKRTKVCLNK